MDDMTMQVGGSSAQDDPVNLQNWLSGPVNRRAFTQVASFMPVAPVDAAPVPAPAFPVADAGLGRLSLTGADGRVLSLADFLEETFTDGLLVLKDGRIVHEWYGTGQGANVPHIMFSVTKSLIGALAGILVDKGQLDPAAPVVDYVAEATGSGFGTATVRHVLDMTVSLDFEEAYLSPDSPFARYRVATGWYPAAEGADPGSLQAFVAGIGGLALPHGTRFSYLSPVTDMLGWICERAGGDSLARLFSALVWKPIGAAAPASLTLDRLGAPRAAGGFSCTARDLARFGECIRNDGRAGGQQVVPAGWVHDIRTNGDRGAWNRSALATWLPGGCYRSQWWVTNDDQGAFFAAGIYGQWLYIAPRAGLVLVKIASPPVGPADDALFRLQLDAFAQITRAVS